MLLYLGFDEAALIRSLRHVEPVSTFRTTFAYTNITHNSSFGKAALAPDGDALVMELQATSAKLKLTPWDGDIFIATLMPTGRFGPVVDSGVVAPAFVQFQMDKD